MFAFRLGVERTPAAQPPHQSKVFEEDRGGLEGEGETFFRKFPLPPPSLLHPLQRLSTLSNPFRHVSLSAKTVACDRMCSPYLYRITTIQPVSPFSAGELHIGGFYWLFPWNFKEKGINHFLRTSLFQRLCHRKRLMFYFLKFQGNNQ